MMFHMFNMFHIVWKRHTFFIVGLLILYFVNHNYYNKSIVWIVSRPTVYTVFKHVRLMILIYIFKCITI